MLSVYTPTHNPQYLGDCYESLCRQTYDDWEWIVLLNGAADWYRPPTDPRVHCIVEDEVAGVGAAKHAAVAQCTGEILVELDHDDILTPDCLAACHDHILGGPTEFVYSDFAQINKDGDRDDSRFNPEHGWEYHEGEAYGESVLVCEGLEPYPSNLGYIWYEPNHVKAFTRDAYDRSGGYDSGRTILDDQDLMCRLYQETDFRRLPECLYLQRVHAGNTQAQTVTNAQIQEGTVQLYDEWIDRLARTWAGRNSLACLDLGAAHNPTPGYLSVDKAGDPDLKGDVFSVLRDMPDSSVGVIRAADFLEHVPSKVGLFNEVYRVLAHGGMFLTLTPSTDGRGAWQDPTHVAGYNENSFWYFTDQDYAKYVPEIMCRFQTSRLVTYFPSDWHRDHHISYVCWNGIAVKTGPRLGGLLRI